jgi:hypothetical protein
MSPYVQILLQNVVRIATKPVVVATAKKVIAPISLCCKNYDILQQSVYPW